MDVLILTLKLFMCAKTRGSKQGCNVLYGEMQVVDVFVAKQILPTKKGLTGN